MKIELDKERSRRMIEKIRIFMENEFDQPIGELKAGLLLEFLLNELGPSIYNQGLSDAQAFVQDRLIDLESSLRLDE